MELERILQDGVAELGAAPRHDDGARGGRWPRWPRSGRRIRRRKGGREGEGEVEGNEGEREASRGEAWSYPLRRG